MNEAKSHIMADVRRRVSFAAVIAHARVRLSRLELIGHTGRTALRHSSTAADSLISASIFEMNTGPTGRGGREISGLGD